MTAQSQKDTTGFCMWIGEEMREPRLEYGGMILNDGIMMALCSDEKDNDLQWRG
jgi:hypothetical protein